MAQATPLWVISDAPGLEPGEETESSNDEDRAGDVLHDFDFGFILVHVLLLLFSIT